MEELGEKVVHAADRTETNAGFLWDRLGWFAEYAKLRTFWNTRKAVIQGEQIFDLKPQELKARALMGPLAFNAYESSLAGVPAVALGWLVAQIFPLDVSPTSTFSGLGLNPALQQEADILASEFQKVVDPFVWPFALLLIAWIIGWACLNRTETNPANRRRVGKAFLYYDGAYGLICQALTATGVGLIAVCEQHKLDSLPLEAAAALLLLSGIAWNFYLDWDKLPRKIFGLYGYDTKVYRIWHRNRPKNRAPWSKYSWIWLLFAGACINLVYFASVLLVDGSALLLGNITLALRAWMHR